MQEYLQKKAVPELAHWVWIGIRPLRMDYKENILQTIANNPNYKPHLWTSTYLITPLVRQDLQRFCTEHKITLIDIALTVHLVQNGMSEADFSLSSKPLFTGFTFNYRYLNFICTHKLEATLVNIFRYEVLFCKGGMYCDTDNLIQNQLGKLTPKYGIFIKLIRHTLDGKKSLQFNNDNIIAQPRHIVFAKLLQHINTNAPFSVPHAELSYPKTKKKKWCFEKKGFHFYTKIILQLLAPSNRLIFNHMNSAYVNKGEFSQKSTEYMSRTGSDLNDIIYRDFRVNRNNNMKFIEDDIPSNYHFIFIEETDVDKSLLTRLNKIVPEIIAGDNLSMLYFWVDSSINSDDFIQSIKFYTMMNPQIKFFIRDISITGFMLGSSFKGRNSLLNARGLAKSTLAPENKKDAKAYYHQLLKYFVLYSIGGYYLPLNDSDYEELKLTFYTSSNDPTEWSFSAGDNGIIASNNYNPAFNILFSAQPEYLMLRPDANFNENYGEGSWTSFLNSKFVLKEEII